MFDWVGGIGWVVFSFLLPMFVSFFGLFVWVVWHVVLAQPWIYGYLEVQDTVGKWIVTGFFSPLQVGYISPN